jgi:HSP20 family protein
LTDVFETEEEIVVIVEVAGIDQGEIKLTLEKGFLIIRGFRREVHGLYKKRQYYTMEIDYGPFERIIRLPDSILSNEVQAQMKNGLLVITVKKSFGTEECREIKIK